MCLKSCLIFGQITLVGLFQIIYEVEIICDEQILHSRGESSPQYAKVKEYNIVLKKQEKLIKTDVLFLSSCI